MKSKIQTYREEGRPVKRSLVEIRSTESSGIYSQRTEFREVQPDSRESRNKDSDTYSPEEIRCWGRPYDTMTVTQSPSTLDTFLIENNGDDGGY